MFWFLFLLVLVSGSCFFCQPIIGGLLNKTNNTELLIVILSKIVSYIKYIIHCHSNTPLQLLFF